MKANAFKLKKLETAGPPNLKWQMAIQVNTAWYKNIFSRIKWIYLN